MWEYIVIGHAVLTIYLVISMYNTLCMGEAKKEERITEYE